MFTGYTSRVAQSGGVTRLPCTLAAAPQISSHFRASLCGLKWFESASNLAGGLGMSQIAPMQ